MGLKTLILLFVFSSGNLLSQHSGDGKFLDVRDTTEVINVLNGEWKLTVHKRVYKIKFFSINQLFV